MTIRFIRSAFALAISVWLVAPAPAQEPMRMLGKHEHGHGTLNIAIEGDKVLIELRAPGDDIVGFEHVARTAEDKAALAKAQATLKAPLALFALPSDAACRVDKANVTLAAEGEDEPGKAGHKAHGGHTEFHADYALTCAHPERIDRLAFPFFTAFPHSRELDVTVLTEQGQTSYEVERSTPAVTLKRAP